MIIIELVQHYELCYEYLCTKAAPLLLAIITAVGVTIDDNIFCYNLVLSFSVFRNITQ